MLSISNEEPKNLFLRSFGYCLRALSTSQGLFISLFLYFWESNCVPCACKANIPLLSGIYTPWVLWDRVSVEIQAKMRHSLYSALPKRHLVFTLLKGDLLPAQCPGERPAVGAQRTIHQGAFIKSLCDLFSIPSNALLAYRWGQSCNHNYKWNQPIHFIITVKAHHQPKPT